MKITTLFFLFIWFSNLSYSQCASNATNTADSKIDNVVLIGNTTDITNNSAGTTCETYTDFTALAAPELTVGLAYQVVVTLGTCNGDYNKSGNVYIDWNGDGDFGDTQESLGETALTNGTATFNFNFTVPGFAVPGNVNMRIVCKEGGSISPCGTYTYGETEDYTVNIIEIAMFYTSSATTQNNVTPVIKCLNNNEIMGIEVLTSGSLTPIDLTQIQFDLAGSTSLSDISMVNIYYTGNSNTFSTGTLFGSVIPAVGPLVVDGVQTLEIGTNYFWITVDLNALAVPTNILDVQCSQITVGGLFPTPVVSTTGTREIVVCTASPGGVSNDLEGWYVPTEMYSDNGVSTAVNNGTIQQWNDVSGNSNHVIQAVNTNKPIFHIAESSNNFNGYGTSDGDDFLERSTLLGRSSDGAVYYSGRTTSITSGQQTALGFGESAAGFSNDGDDPHIGINNDKMHTWHDRANGSNGQRNYTHTGLVLTTDMTYIFNQKWTNGPNGCYIRNNGIEDFAPLVNILPLTVGEVFSIYGAPGASPVEFWIGRIPEVVVYKNHQSTNESQKVESYLAIKYGTTLGINGTSLDYLNTSSTIIWSQSDNIGYNNDIGGIAKDDATGLNQPKSHSTNTTAGSFNDIVTIANGTNFVTPSGIVTNNSTLMWGHNNGPTVNTGAMVNITTDNGETMQTIFQRHWKSQETGTVSTVTLEFDMSNIIGSGPATGTNDLTNLRLLVDEDGNFNTDATSISPSSFDNTTNLAYFQVDFVPTSGTESDQNRGFFFTLASTNISTTPLPVSFTGSTCNCNLLKNTIKWNVVSEKNNDYFDVLTSNDGEIFDSYKKIYSLGNYNGLRSYEVNFPSYKFRYYKIIQIDMDGTKSILGVFKNNCEVDTVISIYPNPNNGEFRIKSAKFNYDEAEIIIYDTRGTIVYKSRLESENESFNLSGFSTGIYSIVISDTKKITTNKLIIK